MYASRRRHLVHLMQRRVGYASAIACALLTIVNLIAGYLSRDLTFTEIVANPAVYVLAICSVIAYLTTLRDREWLRIVQVSVFLLYSFVASIIIDPSSLHGALFGIYAMVLSLQYGLIQRRFWLKISLLAAAYTVIRFLAATEYETFLYHAAPAVTILVALFVYLFWIIFAEEIRVYTSENNHLKAERDRNQVFVKFGQNISGVVHNLKSTLMSISGCIDVLGDADASDRRELLEIQKSSTTKMLTMINNFMTAVRSYQRFESQPVSLNQLVESSIEVLRGNPTLKHKLKFEVELGCPDTIYAVPMEIMQVIDNIVTNAAEAMQTTERYILKVRTEAVDGFVRLSVIDEGCGIAACERCTDHRCMSCDQFRYGKTTKSEGVGIGMMYVREILGEIGGVLHVRSRKDVGTAVLLDFPIAEQS